MEICKSLQNQRKNSLMPFCLLSSNSLQHSAILVSVSPLFFFLLLGYFRSLLCKGETESSFPECWSTLWDSLSWNWVVWLLGLLNSWYGVQVKLTAFIFVRNGFAAVSQNLLVLARGRRQAAHRWPGLRCQLPSRWLSLLPLCLPGPSIDSSPAPVWLYRTSSPADLLDWILVLMLEGVRTRLLSSQWVGFPWVRSPVTRIR